MSENSQISSLIIGEKQGVSIYKENPSVPNAVTTNKKRRVQVGSDQRGFILDHNSGEISVGGAAFYEFEEVDDTKFVKLFLAGVKQFSGLSKSALELFEVVYKQLQNKHGEDKIVLSLLIASDEISGMNERKYHRALRELLEKEILFRSPADSIFFVNIRFMFNGDRLAFVKGYQRKGAARQQELQFVGEESE